MRSYPRGEPGDRLRVANDLGIKHKVFVNRGYELGTPGYGYHQVDLLSQVPPLLGL
ncbi:hypothetical protein P9869_43580 [Streptomyces ossamyceticus]|nr:hypothetical protein [Streptomyces ossamyceticus]